MLKVENKNERKNYKWFVSFLPWAAEPPQPMEMGRTVLTISLAKVVLNWQRNNAFLFIYVFGEQIITNI